MDIRNIIWILHELGFLIEKLRKYSLHLFISAIV